MLAAVPFDGFSAPADALLGPGVELNGVAYFFARDSSASPAAARAELWRSDGTPAGTAATGISFPVKTAAETPSSLTVFGDRLLFAANDAQLGRELWVSDGSVAGTAPASDFTSPDSRPDAVTVVGGQAFFTLDEPTTGRELWRTDGTPGGTRMVADIRPSDSSNPALLTPFNGRLFFVADDGTRGAEIWSSDGTPEGTSILADLRPGSSGSQVTGLHVGPTVEGERLFFDADAGGLPARGSELWITDGAATGTRLVKDIRPGSGGSRPTEFTPFKGAVYFSADDGTSGRELWRSDGTEAGTARVADVLAGVASPDPHALTPLGDRLLFTGPWPQSAALWSTDGTEAGTRRIVLPSADPLHALRDLRIVGNRVVFAALTARTGEEPWATDGTDAGTVPLRDIAVGSGSSRPLPVATAAGRLVFAARDMFNGAAPWVTDGTSGGTVMLKRIAGDRRDIEITRLVPAQDTLYAFGTFPSPHLGTAVAALWRTDGTAAGTHLVYGGPFAQPTVARVAADKLFFGGYGVWVTDGTAEGTYPVYAGRIADHFTNGQVEQTAVVGDTFYFAAQPDLGADELWKSDGTPAGTVKVKGFGGVAERDRAAAYFRPVGNRLVFWTIDGEHGYEPWVSDGTDAGTVLLYDVNLGPNSSAIHNTADSVFAAAAGGKLYFRADDGTHANALWQTDGTPGGTRFVKDLVPGSNIPLETRPWGLSAVEDDVLYFMAYDTTSTLGVWRTEGTDAGTRVVVGGMSNWLTGIAVWDRGLYLPFNTGASSPSLTPATMYRSDGTPEGTVPVRTFLPDPAYSSPAFPVTGPDGVYFMARTATGRDLWKTDGTPGGTALVFDAADDILAFNLQPAPFAGGMWFIYDGKAWTTRPVATVAARHVFFNNSSFDGNDAAAGVQDDAAVAPETVALLAGAAGGPANITNYIRGLNGIMVDIDSLPADAILTADDFSVRAASGDSPPSVSAAAPLSITIRRGAGAGGSDRATLIWGDYDPASVADTAVANSWLEVTVKANEHTGLSAPDVFAFGNLIGEAAEDGRVNSLDLAAVKRMLNTAAAADSRVDFNRDGRVNALDLAVAKRNLNRTLAPPPLPPPAPAESQKARAGVRDDAVESVLA